MNSKTVASILEQFKANELLNKPGPPFMKTSPLDLRQTHPAGQVSQEVIEVSRQALRDGQTHYVDVPGIGPLREALAGYLNEQFGATFKLENILVTAGVQESRFLTIQKVGEEFEEILIPEVVHPGALRAAGVRPPSITKLAVDPATMLATLSGIRQALEGKRGACLLYLESPSRLTGKAYGADEVAALAELIEEFDAAVIWDQGLAPWLPESGYASLGEYERIKERVVALGEVWPGTGLDSWFIGYIAAPLQWFEPMRSQKQIMAICTNTATQYAALQSGQLFLKTHTRQLQQLVQRRQDILKLIEKKKLTQLPSDVATIVALQLQPEEKDRVKNTLDKAGFQVGDGAHFGAPDVLRLAITIDNRIDQALQSLA